MRNNILILTIVFAVIALIVFLSGGQRDSEKKDFSKSNLGSAPDSIEGSTINSERERWGMIIDEVGGEEAYQEFKRQYMSKSFSTQHLAAHIFGALLYEKLGIRGQTVCDNTFAFGCYHSFFGGVLADKGPSIVSDLDQICVDKFGPLGSGCQHGIGHGIMEYYGPTRLEDALYGCNPTTAINDFFGCTSGVFMEYNTPVLIGEGNASVSLRPIIKDNPYDPCPSVPKSFQRSCYYSIGQWWNNTSTYRKNWEAQGNLCRNIPDLSYLDACYLGIGYAASVDSLFDPIQTIEICGHMPGQHARVICQAGGYWGLTSMKEYKDVAGEMCRGLTVSEEKECLKKGDLLHFK